MFLIKEKQNEQIDMLPQLPKEPNMILILIFVKYKARTYVRNAKQKLGI